MAENPLHWNRATRLIFDTQQDWEGDEDAQFSSLANYIATKLELEGYLTKKALEPAND
jgi:hypothetical protein